ncbi:MAG: electron transport complex subunit E [Gammaproteobacteria bacterium]|nr:electron transport complex subunit E [Gammaproteobacteria bacterium]
MSSPSYGQIGVDGLWRNNPALVQLLGLCPLLAVTGSVVNALGLGLATLVVLTCSNIVVSIFRNYASDAIRLPAFVMIIATFTTCAQLVMQAFTYELYLILGIFIPLIVTNCAILGRADAFASKNNVIRSAWDGISMGTGFLLVLLVLGACREILAEGKLFTNMSLLFGDAASTWEIQVFSTDYPGFLVAALPPGAFIITGFLIALKQYIDGVIERAQPSEAVIKGSKRVRTTGDIA